VNTSDANASRASALDTTSLSDALDRLGIAGQCLNIKPLEWTFQMTGRAYTILYGPSATPSGTVGDYIDDVEPDSVIVLDNGGRENATVWGDILTWVATRRRISGTVIDGACRDTRLARELGYPIFSRSYSMRTGKDRVQVEGVNCVVNIGDARVAPGDLLRGDADGVLVFHVSTRRRCSRRPKRSTRPSSRSARRSTQARRSQKRGATLDTTSCRRARNSRVSRTTATTKGTTGRKARSV